MKPTSAQADVLSQLADEKFPVTILLRASKATCDACIRNGWMTESACGYSITSRGTAAFIAYSARLWREG